MLLVALVFLAFLAFLTLGLAVPFLPLLLLRRLLVRTLLRLRRR